jgi:hypothetical protein
MQLNEIAAWPAIGQMQPCYYSNSYHWVSASQRLACAKSVANDSKQTGFHIDLFVTIWCNKTVTNQLSFPYTNLFVQCNVSQWTNQYK